MRMNKYAMLLMATLFCGAAHTQVNIQQALPNLECRNAQSGRVLRIINQNGILEATLKNAQGYVLFTSGATIQNRSMSSNVIVESTLSEPGNPSLKQWSLVIEKNAYEQSYSSTLDIINQTLYSKVADGAHLIAHDGRGYGCRPIQTNGSDISGQQLKGIYSKQETDPAPVQWTPFYAAAVQASDDTMSAIEAVRSNGLTAYACQVYAPAQAELVYPLIETHTLFASNEKDALAACLTQIDRGILHIDNVSKVIARALSQAPDKQIQIDRIMLVPAPQKP